MNFIDRPLGAGEATNNPQLIVVHSMAEYVNDPEPIYAPDFLERYGLSAHALVLPDGNVMICRHPNTGAYHARGYNRNSLGVEFLVNGQMDYSTFVDRIKTDWVLPDQWQAGIELVQYWINSYSINEIVRHSDISPGRKVDPGSGFHWEEFINNLVI